MELIDRVGIALHARPVLAANGMPWLLLVAKASFTLPDDGGEVLRCPGAPRIVEVDEFEGEPGFTPPLHESDLAVLKPRGEVLLNGSAYAPGGRAVDAVAVQLRVGPMRKAFRVHGPRRWRRTLDVLRLEPSQAFTRQTLSYAHAYGGTDTAHPDPGRHASCAHNPVGTGFHVNRDTARIDGRLAPCQQPLQHQLRDPWQTMPALSFGPVGRNWQPRLALAGTFDEAWRRDRSPFLPADFDPLHWQAAPADQQLDRLDEATPVELLNLTPDARVRFVLPALRLQAQAEGDLLQGRQRPMRLDTLLLEPDLRRFTLVWRTHWSLGRRGEVDRIEVSSNSPWPAHADPPPASQGTLDG